MKPNIIFIFAALMTLLSGCATVPPRTAITDIIKPAPLFSGRYNSAQVGVFGSFDGKLKISQEEANNISKRVCANLYFDHVFDKVQKYSRDSKDADLYVFTYIQDVEAKNIEVTREIPGFGCIGFWFIKAPIGYRTVVQMYMLVRLVDAKSMEEIGSFECGWATDPLEGYANDILSSNEVDFLAEAVSKYLKTLL